MSGSLSNLNIGGIVCFVICIAFFLGGIYKKFHSSESNLDLTTKILLGISAGFFVLGLILVITSGTEAAPGTISTTNQQVPPPPPPSGFANVETFGNTTTTYTSAGTGPLIDGLKIENWLNGQTPGTLSQTPDTSNWPDGNGETIQITSAQFQSLYGFIPPSFVYFPEGQGTNNYTASNYQDGRIKCMQACTLTNCTAVQTEVPQNCAQEALSTSGAGTSENSCGNNATMSCTLFYSTISNADDAYWTLNNYNQGGCMDPNIQGCLGIKYYEDAATPTTLPDSTKLPSQSTVKFCDSSVYSIYQDASNLVNGSGFWSVPGGSSSCSCTDVSTPCTDTNCCVMRNMLTTEYMQHKHPFYTLPINVSQAANGVGSSTGYTSASASMVVPSLQIGKSSDIMVITPQQLLANVPNSAGYTISGMPTVPSSQGTITQSGPNYIFTPPSNTDYSNVPVSYNVNDDHGNSIGTQTLVIPANKCCGLCTNPATGEEYLVSCIGNTCQSWGDTNCWTIDWTQCLGDPWEGPVTNTYFDLATFSNISVPNEAQTALNNYKAAGAPTDDYSLLFAACYYRQIGTVTSPVQIGCNPNYVTRGCTGGPPIISTETLSYEYGACSNNSIIPQTSRCQETSTDSTSLAQCTGFPYSCGTVNGTNNLWVRA